jgi:O-antigen/teichoic acid export membrane protein
MSRTKKFLGGVSLGYVNQALLMIAGLWLTPFLLNHIGQNDYGLWLVGTQIMFYLALVDFGVVALLPREAAYATGRANGIEAATDLPDIIGQTTRLVLWQMPFVILVAILLWLTMPADWQSLRQPLGLVIVVFVVLFPLRIFPAILQGLQDLSFLGKVQICAWALSTAITIALVSAGLGLYALAIGWAINQAVSTTAYWLRLRARFPGVLPGRLPVLEWSAARALLTRGFWLSAAQVAQVLLNGTDILIIGKVLGPLAVVPYACTGKLISVLANQPQLLMQAAFPALSEMRMGESRKRLFQVCTALSQAMLIISGGVICTVLVVNHGFINWWIGPDQYGGFWLTVALLSTMLLRHYSTTGVYALLCLGYERRISLTHLLDGFVTLSGALIFIHLLGPIGGPLGSILGVCLVSLPSYFSVLARELQSSRRDLLKPLWPWFWRFFGLALILGFLARIWTPNTFMGLAATTASIILVYSVVMLPMALESSLGVYLKPGLVSIRMRLLRARSSSDLA